MTSSQPLALIAELTHRCPLHCVYCSNPLEMQKRESELSTAEWSGVFAQASALGVHHAHFTGGEPLARADVTELVAAAHSQKLYTNLITSGMGLTEKKLAELIAAGLDHVQLSFQDVDEKVGNQISGTVAHARKLVVAKMIGAADVAFTINIVIHRQNIPRHKAMIDMASELGASKLEVAHVQYYGWAYANREHLLPTREQLDESAAVVKSAQETYKNKMRIDFVVPDYYGKFPKPCMGGWGKQLILIDPSGRAMPCHAAGQLPGLEFFNVKDKGLEWIWRDSPVFNKYRGKDWMHEPCRSCERNEKDFGGCRCQAFMITGDAGRTDPVCSLSPDRPRIDEIIARNAQGHARNSETIPPWRHRDFQKL